MQKKQSNLIKTLDPINFDNHLELVPVLNYKKDIHGLVQLTYQCLPSLSFVQEMDYEHAIACMRDLGILIGSIKRHGFEPLDKVPELEAIVLELGRKTNLPPRDTLFHYTIWNPEGDRKRTYTGLEDEKALIESVRMSYTPLIQAINTLVDLHSCNLRSTEFTDLITKCNDLFRKVVESIVYAKRNVSPQLFGTELRFYFDPIHIKNVEYIGPGAVELPMFVFDHLLWSCDETDTEYTKFKSTYLPFNLASTREVYHNFSGKKSLISKVVETLEDDSVPVEEVLPQLKALQKLCISMKSFRMPHQKMAKKAYVAAKEYKPERSKGSGGYSTDILGHIIELMNNKISMLEVAISQSRLELA